ncbi:dTDP-4-dehydrorhamnose 3,5-epimerase family protein [Amycolatopsis sp. NPDC049868]|uniref:dTDP-4-dehydrorhamnose 3,5-epimerase family protein n=1 Tax=Amycolatopsis sp. NPDC049868 TaxID=3363934 RepID=UPI003792F7DC
MAIERPKIDGVVLMDGFRYSDQRGEVEVPFAAPAFKHETGHDPFMIQQTIVTRSRRGAVRGVHYTATPPGTAKLVHCVQGQVLDVAVDLRVDSPTFGEWTAIELSEEDTVTVCLPVGIGHLWIARTEGATLHYLLSAPYSADRERAIHPADPELNLPLPPVEERLVSERDGSAPTLRDARAACLLPDLAACAAALRAMEPSR